ncbi:unnamed protein product [Amoebophrya sp. A120]|nr:unnamed protein product [Amoebophrya sp. A120]|eukprot:GSA120T00002322001.1
MINSSPPLGTTSSAPPPSMLSWSAVNEVVEAQLKVAIGRIATAFEQELKKLEEKMDHELHAKVALLQRDYNKCQSRLQSVEHIVRMSKEKSILDALGVLDKKMDALEDKFVGEVGVPIRVQIDDAWRGKAHELRDELTEYLDQGLRGTKTDTAELDMRFRSFHGWFKDVITPELAKMHAQLETEATVRENSDEALLSVLQKYAKVMHRHFQIKPFQRSEVFTAWGTSTDDSLRYRPPPGGRGTGGTSAIRGLLGSFDTAATTGRDQHVGEEVSDQRRLGLLSREGQHYMEMRHPARGVSPSRGEDSASTSPRQFFSRASSRDKNKASKQAPTSSSGRGTDPPRSHARNKIGAVLGTTESSSSSLSRTVANPATQRWSLASSAGQTKGTTTPALSKDAPRENGVVRTQNLQQPAPPNKGKPTSAGFVLPRELQKQMASSSGEPRPSTAEQTNKVESTSMQMQPLLSAMGDGVAVKARSKSSTDEAEAAQDVQPDFEVPSTRPGGSRLRPQSKTGSADVISAPANGNGKGVDSRGEKEKPDWKSPVVSPVVTSTSKAKGFGSIKRKTTNTDSTGNEGSLSYDTILQATKMQRKNGLTEVSILSKKTAAKSSSSPRLKNDGRTGKGNMQTLDTHQDTEEAF